MKSNSPLAEDARLLPVHLDISSIESSMYKVDGLIHYYFQRKISGTAFTEIRRSLEKQQHMADEDREIILREVERKAQIYQQRMIAKRLNRVLLLTGSLLIIVALLFLYAVQTGTISYPRWPAWPSIVLGTGTLTWMYTRNRSLQAI